MTESYYKEQKYIISNNNLFALPSFSAFLSLSLLVPYQLLMLS